MVVAVDIVGVGAGIVVVDMGEGSVVVAAILGYLRSCDAIERIGGVTQNLKTELFDNVNLLPTR